MAQHRIMVYDPQTIVSLLADGDADSQAVVDHLRRDAELRRSVFAWAYTESQVPTTLAQVVFEQERDDLVRQYHHAESLEAGMWLLPRLDNPYRSYQHQGESQLDALAASIARAARSTGVGNPNADSPPDTTFDPGSVAAVLGQDFGFGGDRFDYHHPANSFLPHVIEQRAGLPITVGALWYLVCQRLGLEARLLAIPGHVFGAYTANGSDHFVDLFSHGQQVSRETLDAICHATGHGDASDFVPGASQRQLLRRMAVNLVVSYQSRGDTIRAELAEAMAHDRV